MAKHARKPDITDAIKGRQEARREIAESKWEKAKEDIPQHDAEFEQKQRRGSS